MTDWIAFIITVGEETVAWLSAMQIMGVPVAGIIVGTFLLCVILRAILYKV